MTKGAKVKLQKTLYAARGGGVAIMPNQGSHMDLELIGPGAAQFPVMMGAIGTITDVAITTISVNYANAVIRFKKGVFGWFNLIQP